MKVVGKIIDFLGLAISLAAAIFLFCWAFFHTNKILATYTATVKNAYTEDLEETETDANGTSSTIETHYYVICNTDDGYTITIDDEDTYEKYKNSVGSEITINQKQSSLFGLWPSVYWEEAE